MFYIEADISYNVNPSKKIAFLPFSHGRRTLILGTLDDLKLTAKALYLSGSAMSPQQFIDAASHIYPIHNGKLVTKGKQLSEVIKEVQDSLEKISDIERNYLGLSSLQKYLFYPNQEKVGYFLVSNSMTISSCRVFLNKEEALEYAYLTMRKSRSRHKYSAFNFLKKNMYLRTFLNRGSFLSYNYYYNDQDKFTVDLDMKVTLDQLDANIKKPIGFCFKPDDLAHSIFYPDMQLLTTALFGEYEKQMDRRSHREFLYNSAPYISMIHPVTNEVLYMNMAEPAYKAQLYKEFLFLFEEEIVKDIKNKLV